MQSAVHQRHDAERRWRCGRERLSPCGSLQHMGRRGFLRGAKAFWVTCALAGISAIALDAAAATTAAQAQGARGKIVRRGGSRSGADVDPAALERVSQAAQELANTLAASSASLEIWEPLFGQVRLPNPEDQPVAIAVRFDRGKWASAAKGLADALAAAGSHGATAQAQWDVWSCSTKEGLAQTLAYLDVIKQLGPIRSEEALDARRDALGLWCMRQLFAMEWPMQFVGGSNLNPTTMSVFAPGSPFDSVAGPAQAPDASAGTVTVGVVTDISPKSCQLRFLEVPAAVALAVEQAFEPAPSVSVTVLDERGKEVRSSVIRSSLVSTLSAQWFTRDAGSSSSAAPILIVAPGRFAPGVGGPRPRRQAHLDMAWIGIGVLTLDQSESDRASSYEVKIISSREARQARESRSGLPESPQWKAFLKEAESLPPRSQLHAKAIMRFIERVIKSAPPDLDLGPALQAIVDALESPSESYRSIREDGAPDPSEHPDVIKARDLELRAARWAAKQIRD